MPQRQRPCGRAGTHSWTPDEVKQKVAAHQGLDDLKRRTDHDTDGAIYPGRCHHGDAKRWRGQRGVMISAKWAGGCVSLECGMPGKSHALRWQNVAANLVPTDEAKIVYHRPNNVRDGSATTRSGTAQMLGIKMPLPSGGNITFIVMDQDPELGSSGAPQAIRSTGFVVTPDNECL